MFYGLQHKDRPMLADQQKLTFISSVSTLDAIYMTYQEKQMVRESREFMPSAQLDIYK